MSMWDGIFLDALFGIGIIGVSVWLSLRFQDRRLTGKDIFFKRDPLYFEMFLLSEYASEGGICMVP